MIDNIDVHDLPQEEISLLREFVAFLKHRLEIKRSSAPEENDWANLSTSSFAKDWDNEHDAIYDRWKELYHVPER